MREGSADERPPHAFWTDEDEKILVEGIPAANVRTLNPARSTARTSDVYANLGCDLHLVSIADAVLVDVRTKKGIAIGAEMMFANFSGIPVIAICPATSPYRQDAPRDIGGEDLHGWVDPFVYGLSDHMVDSVTEAAALIAELGSAGLRRREGSNVFEAIGYYNRVRETFEHSA